MSDTQAHSTASTAGQPLLKPEVLEGCFPCRSAIGESYELWLYPHLDLTIGTIDADTCSIWTWAPPAKSICFQNTSVISMPPTTWAKSST